METNQEILGEDYGFDDPPDFVSYQIQISIMPQGLI